jgi:serine/threonine protein kinase
MGGGGSKKKKIGNQSGGGINDGGPIDPNENPLVTQARVAINDPACTARYSVPDSEPLGGGAYASVWRAVDTDDNTEWALKIIDKNHEKCDDDEMVNVRWEAEALKICDHLNVTHVREVFETSKGGALNKGFFYVIMEVCNGGELFDRIIEREHYSESDARDAVRCMAEALNHCHKSNVVHLDMKPENVLYAAKEGEPNCDVLKLCDFGISK